MGEKGGMGARGRGQGEGAVGDLFYIVVTCMPAFITGMTICDDAMLLHKSPTNHRFKAVFLL